MKVRRFLGRTLAAAALCAGALAAVPASPAQAAPVSKDTLEFVCTMFGGSFFTTVNGYGCLLAGGDMYVCDQISCYWLPAPRTVDDDVTAPPGGGYALDTTPLSDGYQPVVALDAVAAMTLAQVNEVASLTAGSRFDAVNQVLVVEGTDLSGKQVDALLNGRDADGLRLVDRLSDPSPDTKIGSDHARLYTIASDTHLTVIVLR